MALRLGEGARGWETPEPLTAKPEGTCTYVYATTLDKAPVTEAAPKKLPKLISLGFYRRVDLHHWSTCPWFL